MKLNNIVRFMLLPLALMLMLTACEDEWATSWDEYVEGTAKMHVTIAFDRETSIQLHTRATGGDKGESIQDINSFCMVVYKQKGNINDNIEWELPEIYPVYGCNSKHGDVDNVSYEKTDNRTNEEKTEELQDSSTGKLEFDLKLHSGRYLIYGVANMGALEGKDYSTPDKLKSIEVAWQGEKAGEEKGKEGEGTNQNNQMFGVFSITPDRNAYYNKGQDILVSATTRQYTAGCYD